MVAAWASVALWASRRLPLPPSPDESTAVSPMSMTDATALATATAPSREGSKRKLTRILHEYSAGNISTRSPYPQYERVAAPSGVTKRQISSRQAVRLPRVRANADTRTPYQVVATGGSATC